MAKRKSAPTFEEMIKYYIQKHNLATKQDINRLERKIERKIDNLEKNLKKQSGAKTTAHGGKNKSATENVLNVIKDSGKYGVSVPDIKAETNYDDKKLRNIVFRLHKEGKIERQKRGVYVVA